MYGPLEQGDPAGLPVAQTAPAPSAHLRGATLTGPRCRTRPLAHGVLGNTKRAPLGRREDPPTALRKGVQPPVPLTCSGVIATSPYLAFPASLSGAFSRPYPPAGSRADVVRPSTAPSLRVQLSAPSQCAPLEASCPHLYMAARTRRGFRRAGHHQQRSQRTYHTSRLGRAVL